MGPEAVKRDERDRDRVAAGRAAAREWNWSNPRCPWSDLQHPPDEHLPECKNPADETAT